MSNMPQGLAITVIGVGIVFLVLAVLWGFISCMRLAFTRKEKPAQEEKPAAAPAVSQEPKSEEDDELIAVLTAAVASCLNTSTYRLQIRSFRRIDSAAPAWNMAARRANVENRF